MSDIVNQSPRMKVLSVLVTALAIATLPTRAPASSSQTPLAGAASGQTSAQNSTSLTLYHVVTGKNGKQYYFDRNQKPWKLPGAGVNDGKTLAVYTGSQGQRWYVDKTGTPIDLPPPAPAAQQPQQQPASQNTAPQTAGGPNIPEGSFSIDNQVIAPAPDDSSQLDDCNSDMSSGMLDETTAAELGLTANALQAAADMAESDEGLPYNQPCYWGGDGDPYWWGADGARNYIPRNLANRGLMRSWGDQRARYSREAGSPFGRYYGRSAASDRPAFAHPDSMTPFHSLFTEPMLSGDGFGIPGDGRFTGRDTGRYTGSDTGRYTGSYTGRDTGRYTGDYTGRDTGRDSGMDTGRDTGRYTGRDGLGGLGALNGLRRLGDGGASGAGERMAPEGLGGGRRGGGGRR